MAFNIIIKFKMLRTVRKMPFSSFPKLKLSLSREQQKIIAICRPQFPKYLKNSVVTLIHAGLFMYLPNIYSDLNYLMELKVSALSQEYVLQQYGLIMGKWAVIFGSIGVLTYLRRFDFLDISNRIGVRMRAIAFQKILSSNFYRQNTQFQTYVHHTINDIKVVSQFTGQTAFLALRGLFFLFGGTISLLYHASPYLCLIAGISMTLFNLFYKPRNDRLKKLKQVQNSALIQMSEYLGERLMNIRLIKICHAQIIEQLHFHKQIQKFYQKSRQVAKANGFNYASLQGLGLFSIFTIAAFGSFMISFQITNFSLLASSTYAIYIAMGFRSLVFFNTQMMKIMGVYSILQNRIGSIHEEPHYQLSFDELNKRFIQNMKEIEEKARQNPPHKSKGLSIKIQNLNYKYKLNANDQFETHLYDNFNLNIEAGSVIALVGHSGSGKSTLLNLITKLDQINSGNVLYDDLPLSLMSFHDIQQLVSYVTQQNFLFKGTVAENLKYGNQGFNCTDQNLQNCLKLTNAFDFVQSKGGLDSLIQEGGKNLSGGEKQRIILARSLVKHPRLLLLDEATSGIDPQSEKIIIDNLQKERKGMTTIIISHKLESFERILTQTIHLNKANK